MHLVLSSYGTVLAKENEMFAIINHNGKQLITPQEVKSITISKGARISSDAVLLAIVHEIDVVFVDQKGMPQGRIWSHHYGSIATIRKNQLEFIYSSESVKWIKSIILEKIDNQIALLLTLDTDDDRLNRIIKRSIRAMMDYKGKLAQLQGNIVPDIATSLRGWEGAASKRYFEAIAEYMPSFYRFQGRTQHPAADPFNALLNYGYGMLYGKIEGALIKAGIDPYVGVFHRDDYNRPVLVYDVMEKFRVWIDYVVVRLCREEVFPEDQFVRKEGGVWIEGIVKRILIQAIQDYLSEIITYRRLQRSRENHIQLYAQELASYFQGLKS